MKFGKGSSRELMEIRQDILDEIEEDIKPVGRGEKKFLFNQLIISFSAKDNEQRFSYESAFMENRALEKDIRERLRRAGCSQIEDLRVEIEIVDKAGTDWKNPNFNIKKDKRPSAVRTTVPTKAAVKRGAPQAQLTIIKGQAAQKRYVIDKPRFNIGRLPEAVDENNNIRINDVVFPEGLRGANGNINGFVSRNHAHIVFDKESDEFRLYDDGSENGTRVIRQGRTNEVPKGHKGFKLQTGDEIYFGHAIVRFQIRG